MRPEPSSITALVLIEIRAQEFPMAIATAARQDVVTLHTLLQDKPWNMPLKRGEIQSAIVQFDFDDIEEASVHFKPMVRELAYDCGELAIVTYLQARTYNKALVLLPFVSRAIFTTRASPTMPRRAT
jgi:hypothetical protein